MTKMIKKIVAVGAAVMMMASVSAMGASGLNIPAGNYTMTCSSRQTDSHTWLLGTSINKSNTYVSANGTGYYYTSSGKTTATTSNGNGSNSSGVSCYLTNDKGYGWAKCVSTHTSTVTYKGWEVSGKYVS